MPLFNFLHKVNAESLPIPPGTPYNKEKIKQYAIEYLKNPKKFKNLYNSMRSELPNLKHTNPKEVAVDLAIYRLITEDLQSLNVNKLVKNIGSEITRPFTFAYGGRKTRRNRKSRNRTRKN